MQGPKLHAAAVVITLAFLVPGKGAAAQNASELEMRLEAGALMTSHLGVIPNNAASITPGIRYAGSRFSTSARGAAWHDGDSWHLGDATLAIEVHAPLPFGVRAEVAANANRAFFDPATQNDQVDATGRLHLMRQRGGFWLGTGIARPLRIAAVSNVNVSSGGVWTRLGSTTLRGSVTSFFFTKVSTGGTDTTCSLQMTPVPTTLDPTGATFASMVVPPGCRHESRLTDLEGVVRWEKKLVEVTVRGGHRFGNSFDVTPDSRNWAAAQAALWMTSQVAAVVGGGREPAQPTRGLPARSFGSLGVMLAYWPIPRGTVPIETPHSMVRAFELRPAGTALQRLTARIGGVEKVEIMGDFTDWEPVELIRRGRDTWELLIPMSPGLHQFNIRIDGGVWIAPPGIPSMRDGFNGEVGVIVVQN